MFVHVKKLTGRKKVESTLTEAVTGSVLYEKVLLEILQNSQENTCARVSLLIKFIEKESQTHVFLVVLRKFSEL